MVTMPPTPDRQRILDLGGSFMPACVLAGAADLDLFTAFGEEALTAGEVAARLAADRRATAVLLDAVTAMGLLQKHGDRYEVPAPLRPLLVADSDQSVLPMLQHWANCLRSWAQLARAVKSGQPVPREPSLRGAEADRASFVAGMHVISGPMADPLVAQLDPPPFEHLLDVGGASGTWTLAFLRARPAARATIFDLHDAIEQARARLAGTEYESRIALAAGDFYHDELPEGADLAWVSAIVHQHGRAENRQLLGKVFRALEPGGHIAIRDVVMEASRVEPAHGALFAINMLVNTQTGGTFTLEELAEDLESAGFVEPALRVKDERMNSVVMARKP